MILNRDNLIGEFYDSAPPGNAVALAVRVVGAGGGGGGVQYEEGTMEPFITGTAILWEDSGNILRVPSSTYPLPISGTVVLGAGSAVLGRIILSDGVDDALISAAGRLQVELPAGGGGLTDTELRATPVPVSGAFFQATQPVSLAAGVDVTDRDARLIGRVKILDTAGAVIEPPIKTQFPASLGQKVMAASLAVVLASDQSSIPVTGAFFQATQPVSSTQLPAALVGGRLDVNLGASGITLPVSLAAAVDVSDRAARLVGVVTLGAGSAQAGRFILSDGVDDALISTGGRLNTEAAGVAAHDAAVSGNPILFAGRSSNALPTEVSADGDVTMLWTTRKGSQVVTRTIDFVRVNKTIRFTATNAPVADTICSCIMNTDGVDAGAATTFAVTAGKRFRLLYARVSLRTTTAANPWGLLTIRMNPAGAAVIGSPIVHWLGVGGTAAVIGNVASDSILFPEGWEISGTQQIALTFANNVNTNVSHITLHGYEYTP